MNDYSYATFINGFATAFYMNLGHGMVVEDNVKVIF